MLEKNVSVEHKGRKKERFCRFAIGRDVFFKGDSDGDVCIVLFLLF
jgi:hypothetical protein